ncbi:MAG: hypothetical protein ACWA5W_04625, partial [Phycisphaerales bacterium]
LGHREVVPKESSAEFVDELEVDDQSGFVDDEQAQSEDELTPESLMTDEESEEKPLESGGAS